MAHCNKPEIPEGWWCSREPGHDGPCAARLKVACVCGQPLAPGKDGTKDICIICQERVRRTYALPRP